MRVFILAERRYGPRLGAARPAKRARDREVAEKLWELSEQLTGVRFEL